MARKRACTPGSAPAPELNLRHAHTALLHQSPSPRPTRLSRPRRRYPPEVLQPDEVRALMDACFTFAYKTSGAHWTNVRNRALIATLYRTGLRISEALALRPLDLDLDRALIRVRHGKGGRPRAVGIDPGGAAELRRWLRLRDVLGFRVDDALFCVASGRPIAPAYVRRLLLALANRAGLARRVHAHALRHTHAAELRFEGVDIGVIAKQLGHSSIATTARYLDHVAPLSVVEAMRKREWT